MSKQPLGSVIPVPISLGYVDPERFNSVFESLPTPTLVIEPTGFSPDRQPESATDEAELVRNSALVEAKDIILGLFASTRLTHEQVGVHMSKEVASPGEPVRPGSAKWHSDCQSPNLISVVISDGMSTEFLFGRVPKRLRRAFSRYTLSGYGSRKDYYERVREVLLDHTDDELEQLGFEKVSANPYEAFAFAEKNIHRSPTNKTSDLICRSMVKATVACA